MKVGSAWIKIRQKTDNFIFIVKYDKSIKPISTQNNALVLFDSNKRNLMKSK